MKILGKMQRRATIWILRAFKTLLMEGIEAIARIIPIKFHLQKLAGRSQLRPLLLLPNHIIRSFMDDPSNLSKKPIPHSINSPTNQQRNITKDHLIDLNNKAYGIFSSFLPLHPEFVPGSRITDNFLNCFSFNLANKKEKYKIHFQELDEMVLHLSFSPSMALVITDTSIKNDIAISISHVHSANQPIIKTVHHAAFVTSTKAELFAIRCGINQACIKENMLKIIIVTDSIYAIKIFNSKSHPYQSHIIAILSELHHFFNTKQDNSIEFWECPSHLKWMFHHDINKDSKSFNPTPFFPYKISWDYCKKISDDIINQWKMSFQALDGKGRHFLDLVDDNLNTIEPVYTKGGPWL